MATHVAAHAGVDTHCPLCGESILTVNSRGRVISEDLHPVPLYTPPAERRRLHVVRRLWLLAQLSGRRSPSTSDSSRARIGPWLSSACATSRSTCATPRPASVSTPTASACPSCGSPTPTTSTSRPGPDNLALHQAQRRSGALDHMGFIVDAREEVDRLAEALRGAGVTIAAAAARPPRRQPLVLLPRPRRAAHPGALRADSLPPTRQRSGRRRRPVGGLGGSEAYRSAPRRRTQN